MNMKLYLPLYFFYIIWDYKRAFSHDILMWRLIIPKLDWCEIKPILTSSCLKDECKMNARRVKATIACEYVQLLRFIKGHR